MIADLHTERAILGGLVARPEAWPEVNDVVHPDDWSDPNLRAIATAMWQLLERRTEVDVAAIASELEALGSLRQVGGIQAVLDLANDAVSSHALPRHARRLRDVAAARRLQEVATFVRNADEEALSDPAAWVERSSARLLESAALQREDGARKVRDLFEGALRRLAKRHAGEDRGVPYGYPGVDLVTGGMSPTE